MSILCHGDRDDDRPRLFADYGYFSGDSTPLLVAKDRRTGMTFAAAVSMRGGGDPHAARLLAKWIDGLGCHKVTVRTDGEPSICELIRRVRELRAEGTTTVDEISPPGDSASNGIAERAILTVGGLVRTTVEENVLEGRDAGPRLTAWMVHHAAQVICACMVGADGLTPFRRFKVRKFGTPLAGFGERVWLKDPVLERGNKFNPRCTEARLLGFCLKSSRCIVVDLDGRFRMVRTIKKANADDRWKVVSPRDPFSAGDLESTPAEFTCSRGTRGEVSPAAQRLQRHPVDVLPPDPHRDPVSRRLYLKQSDFTAHGRSDRCPGCRALVSDGRAQGHTEECRIRVEGEIRKTEEGKARLRAAASRVGDAPTGRALKRVRFSESRVDDNAEVPEPTSESRSPLPWQNCILFMKCFGSCQFLRGLWKDTLGEVANIHMMTDAKNLVTTARTTDLPEQKETIHMMSMLRKEACSGNIRDLSQIPTQHCLADFLSKASAKADNLITAVKTGRLLDVDIHLILEHKGLIYLVYNIYAHKGEGCFIPECLQKLSSTDASRRTMSCDVRGNSAYRGPKRTEYV